MRAQREIVTVVLAVAALTACGTQRAPSEVAPAAAPTSSTATPSGAAAPSTAASDESAPFTSARYGYSARVLPGWTADPATSNWDGGDVDHTADYADRFTDPAGNAYFVIGTPTDLSATEFASEHLSWLTANRGCPAPSAETEVSVGGTAGVRAAIHCPDGVFGPTLVSKAMVVADGVGLIVTSFSPDTGRDEFAPLDALVASMRWTPRP